MIITYHRICINATRSSQLKRSRHRKQDRSLKGSSLSRLSSDPRRERFVSISLRTTKFSGDFLKYIVRHKNGVGRPPHINLDREYIAFSKHEYI
jgi:hypothetical protein